MEWNEENTQNLLEMYHERPVLWNSRLADYKDRNKRRDALLEISVSFGVEKEEIEKKIRYLLSHFAREVKKEKDSEKSGNGTEETYKSKWFAYKLMEFLKDKNKPIVTQDSEGKRKRKEEDSQKVETDDGEESLQVLEQSIDGSENDVGTTAQPQPKSNSINIVKSSGRKSLATNLPIVNEAVNLMRFITTKRAEKDEFSLFGEQVAMKLRKIVAPFARFSVQNIINTVLFEAEMGKYDNPHFINHSHPSTPQAYPLQSFNVAYNSIPSPGHYPNTLSGRSSTSTSTINQDEDIHTLLLQL
ncbi:uncharacterized protein [Diabrotica undecimpunctata]|uniref:uncharacterized protein n=1 Tax=Diabrotica undecimpunctata TaxID=50387 RepID=UPI003B63EF0B